MRLFSEAVLVLILAGVIALLANSLNANGLDLANNYFPSLTPIDHPTDVDTGTPDDGSVTEHIEDGPGPIARDPNFSKVAAAGMESTQVDELIAYYEYAGPDKDGVFILDARRPADYERERIPNSTLCYYYQADDYLPELLPQLKEATDIFIYCNGGDCEDSIFLARKIMEAGVPMEVVRIYEGGMKEWVELGHPVASGK